MSPVNRFMALASSTPLAVPRANAASPSAKMNSTSARRNVAASIVAPTLTPRKMVTTFRRAFCAVSVRRSTTFDSRKRLPSMNMTMSGAEAGTSSTTPIAAASGNTSFSRAVTRRAFRMRIARSRSVVSRRMIGGWMIGTSAM